MDPRVRAELVAHGVLGLDGLEVVALEGEDELGLAAGNGERTKAGLGGALAVGDVLDGVSGVDAGAAEDDGLGGSKSVGDLLGTGDGSNADIEVVVLDVLVVAELEAELEVGGASHAEDPIVVGGNGDLSNGGLNSALLTGRDVAGGGDDVVQCTNNRDVELVGRLGIGGEEDAIEVLGGVELDVLLLNVKVGGIDVGLIDGSDVVLNLVDTSGGEGDGLQAAVAVDDVGDVDFLNVGVEEGELDVVLLAGIVVVAESKGELLGDAGQPLVLGQGRGAVDVDGARELDEGLTLNVLDADDGVLEQLGEGEGDVGTGSVAEDVEDSHGLLTNEGGNAVLLAGGSGELELVAGDDKTAEGDLLLLILDEVEGGGDFETTDVDVKGGTDEGAGVVLVAERVAVGLGEGVVDAFGVVGHPWVCVRGAVLGGQDELEGVSSGEAAAGNDELGSDIHLGGGGNDGGDAEDGEDVVGVGDELLVGELVADHELGVGVGVHADGDVLLGVHNELDGGVAAGGVRERDEADLVAGLDARTLNQHVVVLKGGNLGDGLAVHGKAVELLDPEGQAGGGDLASVSEGHVVGTLGGSDVEIELVRVHRILQDLLSTGEDDGVASGLGDGTVDGEVDGLGSAAGDDVGAGGVGQGEAVAVDGEGADLVVVGVGGGVVAHHVGGGLAVAVVHDEVGNDTRGLVDVLDGVSLHDVQAARKLLRGVVRNEVESIVAVGVDERHVDGERLVAVDGVLIGVGDVVDPRGNTDALESDDLHVLSESVVVRRVAELAAERHDVGAAGEGDEHVAVAVDVGGEDDVGGGAVLGEGHGQVLAVHEAEGVDGDGVGDNEATRKVHELEIALDEVEAVVVLIDGVGVAQPVVVASQLGGELEGGVGAINNGGVDDLDGLVGAVALDELHVVVDGGGADGELVLVGGRGDEEADIDQGRSGVDNSDAAGGAVVLVIVQDGKLVADLVDSAGSLLDGDGVLGINGLGVLVTSGGASEVVGEEDDLVVLANEVAGEGNLRVDVLVDESGGSGLEGNELEGVLGHVLGFRGEGDANVPLSSAEDVIDAQGGGLAEGGGDALGALSVLGEEDGGSRGTDTAEGNDVTGRKVVVLGVGHDVVDGERSAEDAVLADRELVAHVDGADSLVDGHGSLAVDDGVHVRDELGGVGAVEDGHGLGGADEGDHSILGVGALDNELLGEAVGNGGLHAGGEVDAAHGVHEQKARILVEVLLAEELVAQLEVLVDGGVHEGLGLAVVDGGGRVVVANLGAGGGGRNQLHAAVGGAEGSRDGDLANVHSSAGGLGQGQHQGLDLLVEDAGRDPALGLAVSAELGNVDDVGAVHVGDDDGVGGLLVGEVDADGVDDLAGWHVHGQGRGGTEDADEGGHVLLVEEGGEVGLGSHVGHRHAVGEDGADPFGTVAEHRGLGADGVADAGTGHANHRVVAALDVEGADDIHGLDGAGGDGDVAVVLVGEAVEGVAERNVHAGLAEGDGGLLVLVQYEHVGVALSGVGAVEAEEAKVVGVDADAVEGDDSGDVGGDHGGTDGEHRVDAKENAVVEAALVGLVVDAQVGVVDDGGEGLGELSVNDQSWLNDVLAAGTVGPGSLGALLDGGVSAENLECGRIVDDRGEGGAGQVNVEGLHGHLDGDRVGSVDVVDEQAGEVVGWLTVEGDEDHSLVDLGLQVVVGEAGLALGDEADLVVVVDVSSGDAEGDGDVEHDGGRSDGLKGGDGEGGDLRDVGLLSSELVAEDDALRNLSGEEDGHVVAGLVLLDGDLVLAVDGDDARLAVDGAGGGGLDEADVGGLGGSHAGNTGALDVDALLAALEDARGGQAVDGGVVDDHDVLGNLDVAGLVLEEVADLAGERGVHGDGGGVLDGAVDEGLADLIDGGDEVGGGALLVAGDEDEAVTAGEAEAAEHDGGGEADGECVADIGGGDAADAHLGDGDGLGGKAAEGVADGHLDALGDGGGHDVVAGLAVDDGDEGLLGEGVAGLAGGEGNLVVVGEGQAVEVDLLLNAAEDVEGNDVGNGALHDAEGELGHGGGALDGGELVAELVEASLAAESLLDGAGLGQGKERGGGAVGGLADEGGGVALGEHEAVNGEGLHRAERNVDGTCDGGDVVHGGLVPLDLNPVVGAADAEAVVAAGREVDAAGQRADAKRTHDTGKGAVDALVLAHLDPLGVDQRTEGIVLARRGVESHLQHAGEVTALVGIDQESEVAAGGTELAGEGQGGNIAGILGSLEGKRGDVGPVVEVTVGRVLEGDLAGIHLGAGQVDLEGGDTGAGVHLNDEPVGVLDGALGAALASGALEDETGLGVAVEDVGDGAGELAAEVGGVVAGRGHNDGGLAGEVRGDEGGEVHGVVVGGDEHELVVVAVDVEVAVDGVSLVISELVADVEAGVHVVDGHGRGGVVDGAAGEHLGAVGVVGDVDDIGIGNADTAELEGEGLLGEGGEGHDLHNADDGHADEADTTGEAVGGGQHAGDALRDDVEAGDATHAGVAADKGGGVVVELDGAGAERKLDVELLGCANKALQVVGLGLLGEVVDAVVAAGVGNGVEGGAVVGEGGVEAELAGLADGAVDVEVDEDVVVGHLDGNVDLHVLGLVVLKHPEEGHVGDGEGAVEAEGELGNDGRVDNHLVNLLAAGEALDGAEHVVVIDEHVVGALALVADSVLAGSGKDDAAEEEGALLGGDGVLLGLAHGAVTVLLGNGLLDELDLVAGGETLAVDLDAAESAGGETVGDGETVEADQGDLDAGVLGHSEGGGVVTDVEGGVGRGGEGSGEEVLEVVVLDGGLGNDVVAVGGQGNETDDVAGSEAAALQVHAGGGGQEDGGRRHAVHVEGVDELGGGGKLLDVAALDVIEDHAVLDGVDVGLDGLIDADGHLGLLEGAGGRGHVEADPLGDVLLGVVGIDKAQLVTGVDADGAEGEGVLVALEDTVLGEHGKGLVAEGDGGIHGVHEGAAGGAAVVDAEVEGAGAGAEVLAVVGDLVLVEAVGGGDELHGDLLDGLDALRRAVAEGGGVGKDVEVHVDNAALGLNEVGMLGVEGADHDQVGKVRHKDVHIGEFVAQNQIGLGRGGGEVEAGLVASGLHVALRGVEEGVYVDPFGNVTLDGALDDNVELGALHSVVLLVGADALGN